MRDVSDFGFAGGTDESELFHFAFDEIVHFLFSYVRVHSRIIWFCATGAPGNNTNLLSRLLHDQSSTTVSAARILSSSWHTSADHSWCYVARMRIGFSALLGANYHDFDWPEVFTIAVILKSHKKILLTPRMHWAKVNLSNTITIRRAQRDMEWAVCHRQAWQPSQ